MSAKIINKNVNVPLEYVRHQCFHIHFQVSEKMSVDSSHSNNLTVEYL